jgi:transcriptional regulator with XRE-family HTH domain
MQPSVNHVAGRRGHKNSTDTALPLWQHPGMRHFIKEWREFRGLTQEQVADQLGLAHKASINKIEAKPDKDLPARRVERFATIFGIKPSELFISPKILGTSSHSDANDSGAGGGQPGAGGQEDMVNQLSQWIEEAADLSPELIPAARKLLRTLKAVGEPRQARPTTRVKGK